MTHILGLLLWGNKWWAHGQLLKRTRRRNYSVPIVYLPKTGTCQIFACTQWTKIGNSILKLMGNTKTLLHILIQAICTLISNSSGLQLLKNWIKNIEFKKQQGAKCYLKREACVLHPTFLHLIFWTRTDPCYQNWRYL